jgi:hypothetical protein
MALLYDRRSELQVGTHALIVGISHYPNLYSKTGPFAELGLGLQPLTSAAISAWAFWEWLKVARLPVPLASCRLMLAASQEEESRVPALRKLRRPCDSDSFIDNVSDWREDASSHDKNITLFLFVGHGLMRSRLDQLLLFTDIGSARGRAFQGAVELNSVVYGMVPDDLRFPKIARRQFYFIDTARTRVQGPFRATDVFDVQMTALDDRQVGIFHSALAGAMAYARIGKETLFSAALLDGLRGNAAVSVVSEANAGVSSDERWGVTVNSLARYLSEEAKRQSEEFGLDISYPVSGTLDDTVIVEIDNPPRAELVVSLSKDFPLPVSIWIKDRHGLVVADSVIETPGDASFSVPSGLYLVEISGEHRAGSIVVVSPPKTIHVFNYGR